MSDVNEQDKDKAAAKPKRLELKKTVETGQVRQSFSHGRTKAVTVEVRKKRTIVPPGSKAAAETAAAPAAAQGAAQSAAQGATSAAAAKAAAPSVHVPSRAEIIAEHDAAQAARVAEEAAARVAAEAAKAAAAPAAAAPAVAQTAAPAEPKAAATAAPTARIVDPQRTGPRMTAQPTGDVRPGTASGRDRTPAPPRTSQRTSGMVLKPMSEEERQARTRVNEDERRKYAEMRRVAEEGMRRRMDDQSKIHAEREAALRRQADEDARKKAEEETRKKAEAEAARRLNTPETPGTAAAPGAAAPTGVRPAAMDDEDDGGAKRRGGPGAKVTPAKPTTLRPSRDTGERRTGKLSVTKALDDNERVRSVASFRRRIEREKRSHHQDSAEQQKVLRDVVVPETITVQELANRMAERGVDVVKALMKMGVMATINQTIDADTAELIVSEFGHRVQRVAESDIEVGLAGEKDEDAVLVPRSPVVTVMGHVDHGKTSLLDALRQTDVVSGEAGGITQHIGAYQVHMKSGKAITFLDTPGHEAFTQMRARGAKVTDIVVLVVAADDSVMPQTVEAIHHAKAAGVPIVIAINKCDKPAANPQKVRQELLQHEIVVEQMGGEVQSIEVSAKTKAGLDALEEAILLQAEILDLKANPDRRAEGVVVEAKLERGRGSVATVLVARGTLHVGDVFVAGSAWGRVRALIDDHGKNVVSAGPSVPVEVLGLQGNPEAGDEFVVVENEARAREVAEFRERKQREARSAISARGSLEQMFSKIQAGEAKELPIVIKTDVQGSLEAIQAAVNKLGTEEVVVRFLHGAIGGINESDVSLAAASKGAIIGFNVRASKQARELAEREGVDIRYYSIIYNLIDDLKALLSGMLAPSIRENFLGYAEIREVFNITKVGKVAGCMVTEGLVKRGAKVRLLRDNVVIHEGALSTLKRFKDEAREVKQGMDCGMSFENYNDIQVGDMIECFELESVAREL